jgi:hypothetical protein
VPLLKESYFTEECFESSVFQLESLKRFPVNGFCRPDNLLTFLDKTKYFRFSSIFILHTEQVDSSGDVQAGYSGGSRFEPGQDSDCSEVFLAFSQFLHKNVGIVP